MKRIESLLTFPLDLAVASLMLYIFWPYVIPEIFPRAVEENYIVEKIHFGQALLLSVFVYFAAKGFTPLFKKKKSDK